MADKMKYCSHCEGTYPATYEFFYREARKKDGLLSICKPCRRAQNRAQKKKPKTLATRRAWGKRNKERINAQKREYRRQHPGLEAKSSKAWRAKYPNRPRAHQIVWRKILSGNLRRRPCGRRRRRQRRREKHELSQIRQVDDTRA